jgi:NTP pyrophosphatase (non-canonical NTP hydrolase)
MNGLRDEIGRINESKGFHEMPMELGTMLMLITSELGEALEAQRHGKQAPYPIKEMVCETPEEFVETFQRDFKDTVEDELADALIRILDTAYRLNIDIEGHVRAKLNYNRTRPYKHGKKF